MLGLRIRNNGTRLARSERMFEYKRIDIRTVDGIRKAEHLVSNGWRIIQSGFSFVLLERSIIVLLERSITKEY